MPKFLFGPASDYRLQCKDEAGTSFTTEWLDAKSDDEAIVLARSRKLHGQCELWSGNRLVATIPAKGCGPASSTGGAGH